MFAIAALIVFLVGLFGGHIFSLNLLYLGLAFLAAHLLWDPFEARYPWRRRP